MAKNIQDQTPGIELRAGRMSRVFSNVTFIAGRQVRSRVTPQEGRDIYHGVVWGATRDRLKRGESTPQGSTRNKHNGSKCCAWSEGHLSLEVEAISGGVLLGRREVFLPLLFSLPVKALVRLSAREPAATIYFWGGRYIIK